MENIIHLNKKIRLHQILIMFWLAWWFIAFYGDMTGALHRLGILTQVPEMGDNYDFIKKGFESLHITSIIFPVVSFCITILFEIITVFMLARAVYAILLDVPHWLHKSSQAYTVSMVLWLIIIIGDQLFMKFGSEQSDMVQATFQLLCFIYLYTIRYDKIAIPTGTKLHDEDKPFE